MKRCAGTRSSACQPANQVPCGNKRSACFIATHRTSERLCERNTFYWRVYSHFSFSLFSSVFVPIKSPASDSPADGCDLVGQRWQKNLRRRSCSPVVWNYHIRLYHYLVLNLEFCFYSRPICEEVVFALMGGVGDTLRKLPVPSPVGKQHVLSSSWYWLFLCTRWFNFISNKVNWYIFFSLFDK